MTADRLLVEWSTPALPDALSVAERAHRVAQDLELGLVAGYSVTDGRTGLHLSPAGADALLEHRIATEVRPLDLDEWKAATPSPEDLVGIQAAVNRALDKLDAVRAGYGLPVTVEPRHDEPRPPVPGGQPPQRVRAHPIVHGAHPADGPPGPPIAQATPSCSAPGSLGRHVYPGTVGPCACGALSRRAR